MFTRYSTRFSPYTLGTWQKVTDHATDRMTKQTIDTWITLALAPYGVVLIQKLIRTRAA